MFLFLFLILLLLIILLLLLVIITNLIISEIKNKSPPFRPVRRHLFPLCAADISTRNFLPDVPRFFSRFFAGNLKKKKREQQHPIRRIWTRKFNQKKKWTNWNKTNLAESSLAERKGCFIAIHKSGNKSENPAERRTTDNVLRYDDLPLSGRLPSFRCRPMFSRYQHGKLKDADESANPAHNASLTIHSLNGRWTAHHRLRGDLC